MIPQDFGESAARILIAEGYFHIGNYKIFFVGRILGILGTFHSFAIGNVICAPNQPMVVTTGMREKTSNK